jgi:GT2 family glycosyltransferase
LQEVPEEVHAAADKLRFNSIAIVNLGIDRPRLTDKHWIHFPEQDISFFRISFPSNFCEGLNPEGTTSIQAEVSYDRTSVPERDELVSRVLRDLVRVGVLDSADRVSFSDVIYRKYGYVVYDHFRKSAVNTIHSFLNGLSIYPCGRYGMWEYLWSDQAVLSGKKVAEGVRARASLCKSISGNSELADTAAEPMLSVLVVTWNGWTDLRKCLKMLRLSTFRDYELVIVDNASTDGTVENVERFFPEAKVIANQVNLGHPRAVNQGFRHVRGRYVLLLDQDTESPPEAIGQLVDFLERRPDVSVVAPRTYYSDGAVQESARNLPSAMSGLFGRQSYLTRRFPNNVFSRRYLKREKLSADEPFQVEQVGAACMMLRRCLVDEAGPWDEGYFAYWCDTDWFVRLKKMGKKVFCVPQVGIIHHEKNRRGRRKDPWRIREFHRGAYRLYRKHYTMGIFDPRAIMAFLALNLRAALLILLNHLARSEASEDPQT